MSIINQTYLPEEIILVDDNEKKEFYDIPIYKNILKLLKLKNIRFSYFFGKSLGLVHAIQIALENTKTEFVFKVDDDNILDNKVLETLYKDIISDDNVGATSCLILENEEFLNRPIQQNVLDDVYNKMEDIYATYNIQMCGAQDNKIKKVEHLYSNYIFRKEIVNSYPLEFSPASHREDTVFSYEIYRKGYTLSVNPNGIMWHLHSDGGNRLHNKDNNKKNDELFVEKLKEWKIVPDKFTIKENEDGYYMTKNNINYLVYFK